MKTYLISPSSYAAVVVPFGLPLGGWCDSYCGGSVAPLDSQSAAVSEVLKVRVDWNLGLGARFGGQLPLNFAENIRGAVTMAAAPLFMQLVVWGRGRTFGWPR